MAKIPILNMFGRSPIRPLQQHMATVNECVSLLIPLFEAVLEADYDRVNALQEQIGVLEDQADDQKHELRLHLPRTLFLPMERRDLLDVLRTQDSIANGAKDIAGIIRGRQMEIPEEVGDEFIEFVRRSVEACLQAGRAIDELDELLETGFRGPEVGRAQALIDELDRIEKETDEQQIEVRAHLLKIEKSLHPLDAMFIYRVVDGVGEIGDRAQRVGSRLQLMLAQ
ncbi:MAG: TIGR00153 family protein [Gammaproteobacteria bacterium]|nr:TIGR00153 family protein [Gammaproteobacteria bacterium]